MNFWGKLAGVTAFLVAVAGLYTALHPAPTQPPGVTKNIFNTSGCASINVQMNQKEEKRESLQKKIETGRKTAAESKAKKLETKGRSLPQAEHPEDAQQEAQLQQLEQEINKLNSEIQKLRQSCGG